VKSRDEQTRGIKPFALVKDFTFRTEIGKGDLEKLAAADAFASIAGDRYRARWEASAILPYSEFLEKGESYFDKLVMKAPTVEQDVMADYAAIGLTLRAHPMQLLSSEYPFNKCKRYADLIHLPHKSLSGSPELSHVSNGLALPRV
jgi:error-prone DNA polymerase